MAQPATTPAMTRIQRSWSSTLMYLAIGIACLALSALLCATIVSGPVTLGIALIPGVAGAVLLWMAIGGAGEAPCPACGQPVTGLRTGANDGVLCTHCHKYLQGTGGMLGVTSESRVADSPLFRSTLPEAFIFPDQCCVCGKPATRRITIKARSTNNSSAVTAPTIGLTTTTVVSVEVPHCDEHKDGAMLSGTAKETRIWFRSYPYLRAFCDANKTQPG